MIIATYYLDDLPHKDAPLAFHKAGLQETRSGFGRKLTTVHMVQLPGSPKWRRVYCCCYSNIGTCYVLQGKDWVVIQ